MTDLQPYALRVDKSTMRKLAVIAKKEDRKLASMIRVALAEWVEQRIKLAKENAA
jgi:predicted transcriptional regulator